MKNYIFLFLKGLAMGAVNKIPGVSGGTVAFITGIYEDLINSIKKINFKSFKILFNRGFKDFYFEINGRFLTIVFSGVIASFFSVSLILDRLIEKYELYVFGLFFGMIIGSFYVIYFQLERLSLKTLIGILVGLASGLLISSCNHKTFAFILTASLAISTASFDGLKTSIISTCPSISETFAYTFSPRIFSPLIVGLTG